MCSLGSLSEVDVRNRPLQKVFAVVVGIDRYASTKLTDLYGCVRDASDVYSFLTTKLHVHKDNISMLLAPHPDKDPETAYQEPLGSKILDCLDNIAKKAIPGDLIWFHFSGHGSREDTAFERIKDNTDLDEVLCTSNDTFIRDVDLDVALSRLTERGLRVLAVLDACHSGGATRAGNQDFRPRCASKHQQVSQPSLSSRARGTRLKETWFYRPRNYHVIAACQPFETAGETIGEPHGLLTWYLLKILKSCPRVEDLQYRALQQLLDAEKQLAGQQQPVIFGAGAMTIGGTLGPDSSSGTAMVCEVHRKYIALNKGETAGIEIGDEYLLSPKDGNLAPEANPLSGAKAVISLVRGPKSYIQRDEISGDFSKISIGWMASLERKHRLVKVDISSVSQSLSRTTSRGYESLKDAIKHCDTRPFDFDTGVAGRPTDGDADYSVAFSPAGRIELYDAHKKALSPIPKLSCHDSGLVPNLVSLLRHLHSYQKFKKIQEPTTAKAPPFKFKVCGGAITAEDQMLHEEVLAVKSVEFKNTGIGPLYVSIYNLTDSWGVSRIFPNPQDHQVSLVVEPQKSIPELIIKMELSGITKDLVKSGSATAPKYMTDTFKVLVTRAETSWDDFLLDDLRLTGGADRRAAERKGTPVQPCNEWWSRQIDVLTEIK